MPESDKQASTHVAELSEHELANVTGGDASNIQQDVTQNKQKGNDKAAAGAEALIRG